MNTIAHFDYEKEIFNLCHRVSFVLDATNKLVLIFAAVSLFGIFVTCGKRFYKFFSFVGFSLFTIGLFFIIMNIFVNVKVNIQTITILNEAFSFVIREIFGTIFGQVLGKGLLMFFGGFGLIFISNLVHNYFKYRGLNEAETNGSSKKIKKKKSKKFDKKT